MNSYRKMAWQAALAIVSVAIAVWAVQHKAGSTAGLIRNADKGNSAFNRGQRAVWENMPRSLQTTLRFLEPDYRQSDRMAACWQLAAMGRSASNAVSTLLRVVERDQDWRVANEAMFALGEIGPPAREAVPRLMNVLTNLSKGSWSYCAGWALAGIAPEDPQARRALVNALAKECGGKSFATIIPPNDFEEPMEAEPNGAMILMRALGRLNVQSPEVLELLYSQLEHENYAAQATAAEMLGWARPVSPKTVDVLARALTSAEEEEQPPNDINLGATELNKNGPFHHWPAWADPSADIASVQKLESLRLPSGTARGWGLRMRLIRALGRIGPTGSIALPLLEREYSKKENILRFDAAVAAWKIQGPTQATVDVFEKGLQEQSSETRQVEIERLTQLARQAPAALPILLEGFDDPDRLVRWHAVRLSITLGTNAPAVITKLTQLQHDPSPRVVLAATEALSTISKAAKTVSPH